jgi:ABC-2 type transport system ATP-binding protein
MIINKGKLVALDETDKITGNAEENQHISIKGDYKALSEELNGCEVIESVSVTAYDDDNMTAELDVNGVHGSDIRSEIFRACVKCGAELLMMKPAGKTLEDIFMQVVNGSYENREIENKANADSDVSAHKEEAKI